MKLLKYVAVSLLVFGCKTKTVTVEKSIEKEKESMTMHFDSLLKQSTNTQLDWQKQQCSITDNLKLSSALELDSLGNRKPFHFKHYVDGQLAEEIYLEGGEINKETKSNKADEVENKQERKQENTRIESDVGQKKQGEKSTLNKNKKASIKGFQFGFYIWSFLLIVVLIILTWIAKKIKLPDKFKSIFNTKGG
jgi:Fe2+ transport system protein B